MYSVCPVPQAFIFRICCWLIKSKTRLIAQNKTKCVRELKMIEIWDYFKLYTVYIFGKIHLWTSIFSGVLRFIWVKTNAFYFLSALTLNSFQQRLLRPSIESNKCKKQCKKFTLRAIFQYIAKIQTKNSVAFNRYFGIQYNIILRYRYRTMLRC